MDSMSAFARGEAAKRSGARHKVFDWHKAARLIREGKAVTAKAGLASDMEWTSGSILTDGKPTPKDDTYVYLASYWATPVLVLDDGDEVECWTWEDETSGVGCQNLLAGKRHRSARSSKLPLLNQRRRPDDDDN